MKESKEIKISVWHILIIISLITIVSAICIIILNNNSNEKTVVSTQNGNKTNSIINNKESNNQEDNTLGVSINPSNGNSKEVNIVSSIGNIEEIEYEGNIYYRRKENKEWDGEYNKIRYSNSDYKIEAENYEDHRNKIKEIDDYRISTAEIQKVVSYEEYLEYVNKVSEFAEVFEENGEKTEESNKLLKKYYTDENSNYVLIGYSGREDAYFNFDLYGYDESDGKVIVYGRERLDLVDIGVPGIGYLVVIKTNMPVGTEVEYRKCYSNYEIEEMINPKPTDPNEEYTEDLKPIIYLYPTIETEINVKLGLPDLVTCIYPKYNKNEGWNVLAKPNGELMDLNTNRKLYSLYYENERINESRIKETGFVVKGEDTAKFLENKLEILGLNEREAEEFIIFWLPKLEKNKYNYIRFENEKEIDDNMPLEITPKPESIIRIRMEYKKLNNPIEVKEQKLEQRNRQGYTVVEWGGTEIK